VAERPAVNASPLIFLSRADLLNLLRLEANEIWGARDPKQLTPIADVMGWKLVTDPVGPEFMAPPARATQSTSQEC
jgi:hypothetical protein